MRDTRQTVELDVVFLRALAQLALRLAPQLSHGLERGRKALYSRARQDQQLAHDQVAVGMRVGCTALFDFPEPVLQGLHQQLATLGVVQQVVLKVGVALYHPDIAQHFVEHAR